MEGVSRRTPTVRGRLTLLLALPLRPVTVGLLLESMPPPLLAEAVESDMTSSGWRWRKVEDQIQDGRTTLGPLGNATNKKKQNKVEDALRIFVM